MKLKRKLSLARLLPFPRTPSSLLVCETDGFSLRGAVLARSGSGIAVVHAAQSRAAGMEEAVAELVGRLKSAGWRGGRAVLLTPGVVPALLELPVDPKKPRPVEQMEDLVRWEMEPMLMQHTTLWSVGRILVGLGYLTEEQARAVIDMQQGRGKPGGAEADLEIYSFKRFGDLAIELGYIERKQLDECLVRQEWLKTEGEDIACGWAAQGNPAHEENPGSHRWLGCAVSRALMQRWVAVFSRQGVRLQGLYPLAGCAATMLGEGETSRLLLESHAGVVTATSVDAGAVTAFHMQQEPLWLLLESHAGLVTATNLHSGSITGFHMQQASLSGPLEACLEAYHALTPPEPETIWLAAVKEEAGDLPAQLEQVLGREVRALPGSAPPEAAGQTTPGMLGAARHALRLPGLNRCCDVPADGPRKPAWQRLEVRAVAASLLLLLCLGAAEIALQVRMELAAAKKARVDKEAATLDTAVAGIKGEIDRVKKQQEALQAKRDELARTEARIRFFGEELPERAAFLQSLLSALEQSVTEEVVIDHIEEIPVSKTARPVIAAVGTPTALTTAGNIGASGGFLLGAWALNETAAQQFVQRIKNAMQPWGMVVQEVSVIAQAGRLGLQGNAVRLRIVKPPAVAEPQAAATAGSKP